MQEGYSSWSVCLSVVKSHLTSGASVHPENTITYSAGNGDQMFSLKQLAPLQRYTAACTVWLSVQLTILETVHAHL